MAAPVDYEALRLPPAPVPEASRRGSPVVVVGAGPVGLTAAIDLAQNGVAVALLDDDDRLSTGSRAICFAGRTLEIFDRLGCGAAMAQKGVGWNRGRVFHRNGEVFAFDLAPQEGRRRPAFLNLPQYLVEGALYERARALPALDLRWGHRVVGVEAGENGVALNVETPSGAYRQSADWVVAADGARSFLRRSLGLESRGQTFRDHFLIADVRMEAGFPAERWFWFDPPFHRGQSALLHRQPDDLWRIDFQLGWDADPQAEREPERVRARVQALLGERARFELVWASVYTFSCLRMESFRHGRVLFAGDSAHGVSPFGARGANSGVQDADNLAWKLRFVLQGRAPERLIDSYAYERERAADENINHSTRSTDFITPKSPASRAFRDAVLELARECPFARPLVNSGRLSKPTTYADSPLNTADEAAFDGGPAPGAPAEDAAVGFAGGERGLLDLLGDGFALVVFPAPGETPDDAALAALAQGEPPLRIVVVGSPLPGFDAAEDLGFAAARYDARDGAVYLVRPDQHVAARWRRLDADKIRRALRRATGWE